MFAKASFLVSNTDIPQGGRLVSEKRMVSDLYVFDLETFRWEKLVASPEDDVPRPRYFHSADSCKRHVFARGLNCLTGGITGNNQLIIFGGMSNQPESTNPDELCVLNDVRFFDLTTGRWLPPVASIPQPDSLLPRARYAHLSSITADRLFIIGGQDFYNTWLDDVCVYDLLGKAWVQRRDYPRHCGTYRSVAVASNMVVRTPSDDLPASRNPSTIARSGVQFKSDKTTLPPNPEDYTTSETLIHLPYSATPTEEHPSDIHLYSNYNVCDYRSYFPAFAS